MKTTDRAALDDWYAVGTAAEIAAPTRTRLLGQDIELFRGEDGAPVIREILDDGRRGPVLPARERYG